MGTIGGCFGRVGEPSIVKRPETAAPIETGSIRRRSLLTVENDGCVNQPGLLAKRLGIEAVLLQKSRALICKKYISILKQLIEASTIFFRVVEYR
jgi:hypothetical protein